MINFELIPENYFNPKRNNLYLICVFVFKIVETQLYKFFLFLTHSNFIINDLMIKGTLCRALKESRDCVLSIRSTSSFYQCENVKTSFQRHSSQFL